MGTDGPLTPRQETKAGAQLLRSHPLSIDRRCPEALYSARFRRTTARKSDRQP